MKKILLSLLTIGLLAGAQAQVLDENFSYTSGAALTANNWTQIGATATNPISVTSTGLTYTGYVSSGLGLAAALTTSGQDLYRDGSASISTGAIYCSFMLNVSAAQSAGDYFLALLNTGSTTDFMARTWIKSSGTGFQLGISKWTPTAAATSYAPSVLSFNTTYLVVVKYAFSAATTTDDLVSLYIMSSGVPATEPVTPDTTATHPSANDAVSLGRVALRQGSSSNAPTLTIDGIRLADTWTAATLPVVFKSFTVSKNEKNPSLKWSTASEINNNGFEVQRSTNGGKSFEKIGFVKGAGNSNHVNNYSFVDANAINGTACYRIKQIDFDGKADYTKIVCVTVDQEVTGKVISTPNPFNGELSVTFNAASEGTSTIQIIDMLGKVHYSNTEVVNAGSNSFHINTENLTNGIYFVRIQQGSDVQTQRIIKK